MKCPHCKVKLPKGTRFCNACGTEAVPNSRCLAAVVAAVLLAILASMFLPEAGSREKARLILCSNNLKMIGLAVRQYAMDHDDQYPPEVQALRTLDYLTDPKVYRCPASSKRPKTGSSFFTNYVYIGAGLMDGGSAGYDLPIAMDAPRNHDRYITVLFNDGHVHGFSLPRKMTSCVEVLHHLFPDLYQSPEGRLVLENARKADGGGAAR